ncbi:MAG: dihydroorotate dehydrogenase-like protein [Opitutales bacterium]|nr:dihydroorotate dehydrogenase-like protein [Opitutales bacterium]
MKLSTKYLGLDLKNPIIAGASPLSFSVSTAVRLEQAGAAAIVMHSLFEEQIDRQITQNERSNFQYTPEQYVQLLRSLKKELSIPVIASLNSVREGAWVRYAQYLQDAGADALEINLYFLPRTDTDSSSIVEQRAFQIIRLVRQFVSIPISVKISPWITSLPQFTQRMEEAGASGLVLFNRFIQPDIDIETFKTVTRLDLSTPDALLLRLHWLAALYSRTRMDLSASGGIHSAQDVVKAIVSGATSVQCVSALLQNGPDYVKTLLDGLSEWLERHNFSSVDEARENVDSLRKDADKASGRDNYIRMIHSWEQSKE